MKVLCNCWRKSDSCVACYMANVEDWNQIHAIAMSAEAQRRLEEDLRFLESINVWHLVNLRSNPATNLYGYGDRVDSLTMCPSQLGPGYAHAYQSSHQSNYIQGNQYMSSAASSIVGMGSNLGSGSSTTSSSGYGTSLPYPDLIIHTRELPPPSGGYYHQKPELENPSLGSGTTLTINGKHYAEDVINKDTITPDDYKDFSPVIQNGSLSLQENARLKHLTLLPKEPEDYDVDVETTNDVDDRLTPDGRKTVKFSPETVFVERDMDSPFWKAFTERRRLRRIHRQRKQLNAQIAHATNYQPNIIELVKTAFGKSSSSTNNNNNENKDSHVKCTKKNKGVKGEVLVYDNSSQIPEKFTAHYVYSAPPVQQKRSSKLFQMLTCQCCSPQSS